MKTSVIPSLSTDENLAQLKAFRRNGSQDPQIQKARLREAAQEFESLLVEQMFREMRKNVPESPIFGPNNGKEIFQEMLDSEFVARIVDRGGLGLTDILVRSFEPPVRPGSALAKGPPDKNGQTK